LTQRPDRDLNFRLEVADLERTMSRTRTQIVWLGALWTLVAFVFGGGCVRPGEVTVVNGVDAPVPTRARGTPFHDFSTVSFPVGQQLTPATYINEIIIPEGKRLVIEYVSARGCIPKGQHMIATLIVRHDGKQLGHLLPLHFQGTYPFNTNWGGDQAMDCFTAGEATRLYAESGHSVLPSAQRTDGDASPQTPGGGFISFIVSGRLLPEGEID